MPNPDYHVHVSWPDLGLLSAECVDTGSLTSALSTQGSWARHVTLTPSLGSRGGRARHCYPWIVDKVKWYREGRWCFQSLMVINSHRKVWTPFHFFRTLAKLTRGLSCLGGGSDPTSGHCQHFLLTAEQILFPVGHPPIGDCIQLPAVISRFVITSQFSRVIPDWLCSLISSSWETAERIITQLENDHI